jgi:DNA (cytosine-5)-methyltransferase 1
LEHKPLTYIDLFAGCGGLSLGLHNAGWKGLFAIEKSIDAFKTLKHNLIEKKSHFDWPAWLPIRHYDINYVSRKYSCFLENLKGKVDLIVGGPPCQGFSTAGRRFESDKRNTLIKSYIRFIKLIKPKAIFFENVKGFTLEFKINKEKGRNYSQDVLSALNKCGYNVEGRLIDFSEYGIPQKRVRFILVGVRKDISKKLGLKSELFFSKIKANKNEFLISKNLSLTVTLQDAISDLLKEHGEVDCIDNKDFKAGLYSKSPLSSYQSLMRRQATELTPDSHRFANHRSEIQKKFSFILNYQGERNKNLNKSIRQKFNVKKHTIIPLDPIKPCPTITTLPDDLIHYTEPRILTVREYARIQSFPDWFEFRGKYTTGGKQRTKEVPRYSQIGNAIPPLFGELSGIALQTILNGR